SHELRTPLATVRGYAELYRQGAAGDLEQIGQIMGRIEGEAARMSGLVEDLLTLARLDDERPWRSPPSTCSSSPATPCTMPACGSPSATSTSCRWRRS